MDTILAIVILSNISPFPNNPVPPNAYYITPDYVFLESIFHNDTTYLLTNIKEGWGMKVSKNKTESYDLQQYTLGKPRGWSVTSIKTLNRENLEYTTFLNCNCIKTKKTYEMENAFNPGGPPWIFDKYAYRCQVPEIEALPEQTRMNLPFYKEWLNPEYPCELRVWSEDIDPITLEVNVVEVYRTWSIEKRLFPFEKVKEIFGVDLRK